MDQRAKILAAAVLAIVVIGAGVWYWQRRKAPVPPPPPSIGGEIFEKAQNPLKDELPQTNPFKAETNPFKETETNPFIGTYENPFD